MLTFQQHFLSVCRPAKSGSKRALRKVDRSPAQTILEPVTATLAPVFLSELSPSSKPESTRAPSVAWPTSHPVTPGPGQPPVAGWISAGFPPHVESGHRLRRKRRNSPAAWERSPSHQDSHGWVGMSAWREGAWPACQPRGFKGGVEIVLQPQPGKRA